MTEIIGQRFTLEDAAAHDIVLPSGYLQGCHCIQCRATHDLLYNLTAATKNAFGEVFFPVLTPYRAQLREDVNRTIKRMWGEVVQAARAALVPKNKPYYRQFEKRRRT